MIQQKIQLEVIPGKMPPVIHVNQTDHGVSRLQFELVRDGVPYTPSGPVKIQGKTFEHTCTRSGSLMTVDLYEDMTTRAGDTICNLVITEGGSRHGTQNFILRVQKEAR